MRRQPNVKRRVVTKKAYARKLGAKTTIALTGVFIFACGIIGVILSFLVACVALTYLSAETLLMLTIFLGLGAGSVYLLYIGRRTVKEAGEINTGIPLTRANIGDLPVRESLVRASSEPVQEQQDVLLRAATNTDKTPAEQLVRAYQEPVQEEQTAFIPTAQPVLTATAVAEAELVQQRAR